MIRLVRAGLHDSSIVASIWRADKRAFTLSVDDLVELKSAGVSAVIIQVMLNLADD